ncbi:hypothetical protein PG985_004498 [Apiospora marii]|uniref:uncharacterized protein n=1 Tax=Apiospora marii TaxID=335849 RepID=UPI003130869A
MSSSVTTYKHKSLSSEHSIRVFDLLPSICSKAQVEVRIREISLSDRLSRYEALSYARGNGAKQGSHSVLCAGQRLPVTDSCHAALVHLRSRLWTRTIWADAICVDQAEHEAGTTERNCQVKQMGRIFHNASRVIVWLDQADRKMKLMFRAIRLWSLSAKAERLFNRNDTLPIEVAILAATLLLFRIYPGRACMQPSLSDLDQNSWFKDVWTIQEVALARKATVMTGHSNMSWDTFTAMSRGIELGYSRTAMRRFLDSVALRHHTTPQKANSFTTTTLTESFIDDEELRPTDSCTRTRRLDTRNQTLQRKMLRCLPYLQCARSHDKVYSIYGMASQWGYNLPEPDYDRPVEEVFQEFVVAFVHLHGDLTPLTTTLPADSNTGLPSWVPDWLSSRPVLSEEDVDVSGVFASLYPPDWSVTNSSYSHVKWNREGKALEVRGKRIGTISSRLYGSSKGQYDDPASEAFDDFVQACQTWIQSLSVSAIDQSMQIPQDMNHKNSPKWSAMEQFVLFTPWGPARSRQLGPIFPTRDEHSWEFSWDRAARHRMLLGWVHRVQYPSLEHAIAALGDSPFVDDLSKTRKRAEEVPQYRQHVSRVPAVLESNFRMMQRHVNLFANYSFLALDNGLWGRAHLSCQVGDEVWLLAGSDAPVVLRRQEGGGGRCRVVAPAFIEGAMYGRMWADDESVLDTVNLI